MAKCISMVLTLEGAALLRLDIRTKTVMFPIAEKTINMLYTIIDNLCPSLNFISIGRFDSSSVKDHSFKFL